ncbi:MAG TPA: glycosyl hydrolase [Burkholderiales bacterium]|nr:glycosyl hydrolase [Burkholderiales bacterium]
MAKKGKPSRKRTQGGTAAPVMLFIGTRKGAFTLKSDPRRRQWRIGGPHFLGQVVNHLVLDPRDRKTLLCAARAGHLGPTVFRSIDYGRTWREASRPPAFPKAAEGEKGLSVSHVFWLQPAHPSEAGVWYAGTSPQGLFRSEDGGDTWEGVAGFNAHRMRTQWVGGEQEAPPDGATLHSINVDPRDPQHLYIAMSLGGAFESTDGGRDWQPLNRGCAADFIPGPPPEYGQDVHCMRLHPLRPDRLYQQNHCGIYRMERPEGRWQRIGAAMPKRIGDIGFPLVLHPRDPDTAWVFPMDGGTVWPRVSVGGRPAVYVTRDAGKRWQRQDQGLPVRQAWWTVKRQSMCTDALDPVGVYFGTTSGEAWGSSTEGRRWVCLARHLPHIYSIEAGAIGG